MAFFVPPIILVYFLPITITNEFIKSVGKRVLWLSAIPLLQYVPAFFIATPQIKGYILGHAFGTLAGAYLFFVWIPLKTIRFLQKHFQTTNTENISEANRI